ncbi:MAG TPA: hypothetical protein VKZ53_30865 [Candidatus Angelobacter sp.]|nr:hypothetical protein [Candidatus Angelobacter sp.]
MDGEVRGDDQAEAADSNKEGSPFVGQARAKSHKNDPQSSEDNTGDHQQPSHTMKILFQGHSSLEWIQVLLACVLALVGIFYTFYAAMQWQAMKAALQKTDIAIGQTNQALELNRQALELNRRQTVATEASASAAGRSVEIAGQGLGQSARSFRLDQRPYLIVERFAWGENALPSANKRSFLNVWFKDIGRTPAIRTRIYRSMFVATPETSDPGVDPVIDRAVIATQSSPLSKPAQDIAPQSDMFITADIQSISEEDVEAIHVGAKALYVIAGISYRDDFSAVHETQLCIFYFGDEPSLWHFCSVHNTIR